MNLHSQPDNGMLLVRTDYSEDDAWRRALRAATAVYPGDDWRIFPGKSRHKGRGVH